MISRDDTFTATRWTVVRAAGATSSPASVAALEVLCRAYWFPLYAYVRRRGHARHDAEDLTQAFFARLLGKNPFAGLDREHGKFRAFLLAALKNFLANEWDKARRQKRGGGVPPLSLDWRGADERYGIEPADTLSPDRLYDRAWALTLLERVVASLRDEYAHEGKERQFETLRPCLATGRGAVDYAGASATLGLSEGALRVAAHRLRRRYRELLRAELAQTLSDPAQVDEELRALFAAVAVS